MKTYQDFLNADNKEKFILQTIAEYKASSAYNEMTTARQYYNGENTHIMKRMKWFYNSEGYKQNDAFIANNRVASEFFKKIVKQENSYLLSNGITLEKPIKEKLGRKFDTNLNRQGINALVEGVTYGYCFINNGKFEVSNFNAREFIALLDERDGTIKAGIRFYRVDTNKPMYVELYELEGKTVYRENGNILEIEQEQTPYMSTVVKDALGTKVTGHKLSKLPIVPLYGNDSKRTTLTPALKNKIDLWDIVLSDFGNNLEDANDVYWIIRNYQGQDIGEFLADWKQYKTIQVDDNGDARPETIEVPYQARQTALEILRKEIYSSAMALDTDILSGGSLTNVAIKVAMTDLDLKTDEFEWNVIDYVDNIISIASEMIKLEQVEQDIKFIRRSITNDTEIVDNITTMRSEISHETYLELNPYIDDVDKELERYKEELETYKPVDPFKETE